MVGRMVMVRILNSWVFVTFSLELNYKANWREFVTAIKEEIYNFKTKIIKLNEEI